MKRLITSVTILFMAVGTMHAQDAKQLRERKQHAGSMMHNLKLSDEQKQKMKSYQEDFRNQMMDLKKNDNITVKEYRTRIESLRKGQKEKIQGLLTTDQKKQIEKSKLERKSMHEIDAKARAEKMKVRFGLTEEQSKNMMAMHKAMAEKIKTIRENEALSRDDRMQQLRSLKEKQRNDMKSILSPEQLKKMEDMKKKHTRTRV